MQDSYETRFDRYDTPFDGDAERQAGGRLEGPPAEMNARLTRIEASLDRMNAMLDRVTGLVLWWAVIQSIEILIGFGLVAWRR
jgi:hypothetical protein